MTVSVSRSGSLAFSLFELLAAMVVMTVLVLMVGQMVSSVSKATSGYQKTMDSDSQARLIFSQMALDFAGMLKRQDADCIFYKQAGVDEMFFYSEAPASYDSSLYTSSSVSDLKNLISLVGYRVAADPNNAKSLQLQRLGKGLTWDAGTPNSSGSVVFLTYPFVNGFPGNTPVVQSTLDGNWASASPTFTGTDADYHAIGDQVFRLSFCFLLDDGSYSNVPAKALANVQNNLSASTAPMATNDGASSYSVGSRWFNTASGRAYICMNSTPGAAVWRETGLQDVTAIVVALGILDQTSRKVVLDTTVLPGFFPDATDSNLNGSTPQQATLMEQLWKTEISGAGFIASAEAVHVPAAAASQIRVYQRYFYLNNP